MKNLSQMKVAIVGLGQIGGSLAKAFTKEKMFAEIIGVDKNPKTIAEAKRLKIVNRATNDLKKAGLQADLVILAIPVRQIIKILPEVAASMKKETILYEVGSAKDEVFKTIKRLPQKINYIGLHPMAGTEKEGIDAADENLFGNKTFMIFPSKNNRKSSLRLVLKLVKKLKAKPLIMNIKEHDQILAKVSHLPYLFSIALVNFTFKSKSPNLNRVLGGSFKDATRVAKSSPEMMLDVLITNRKNIIRQIDGTNKELLLYKSFLQNGDEDKLSAKIMKARKVCCQLKFL